MEDRRFIDRGPLNPHYFNQELSLDYTQHARIQKGILLTSDILEEFHTPQIERTSLANIPLTGDMRLTKHGIPNKGYSRLDFESVMSPIDFMGERVKPSAEFTISDGTTWGSLRIKSSSDETVDNAYQKQFNVYVGDKEQSDGILAFDDLMLLLDNVAPGDSSNVQNFSDLADPRNPYSFNQAISIITKNLKSHTKPLNRSMTRTYTASDPQISVVEGSCYMVDSRVRLEIKESARKKSYTLSATAPLELEQGRVWEHIYYQIPKNSEHDPRTGLQLVSHDLTPEQLRALVAHDSRQESVLSATQRALLLLINERTTPTT